MKAGAVYSPKQLHDDAKAIADAYGTGGYVDTVIQPEGSPAGPGRINIQLQDRGGPTLVCSADQHRRQHADEG